MSSPLTCVFVDPNGPKCRLGLCADKDLAACCDVCPKYVGPERGLGDPVKKATNAVGIPTCGGCQQRRRQLNQISRRVKAVMGYQQHQSRDQSK